MTLSAARPTKSTTRPTHVRRQPYGPLWLSGVCLTGLLVVVVAAAYRVFEIARWLLGGGWW